MINKTVSLIETKISKKNETTEKQNKKRVSRNVFVETKHDPKYTQFQTQIRKIRNVEKKHS